KVIVSDQGDVTVRPCNLWEGSPVYDALAGLNSSMPPSSPQPDLLVGTYNFDCCKGVMKLEDTDRNRFEVDITKKAFLTDGFSITREGGNACSSTFANQQKGDRKKHTEPGGSGNGLQIILAGESPQIKANALVDNPLEPRLFIYRRDGSAVELLRIGDTLSWREKVA
ncbi:unnamed protein product, partial [Choristocarpus tenellus]